MATTFPETHHAQGALPFWATPRGVFLIAGAYFLAFALIATFLHSALGVDNAIENYNAQSLAVSYTGRNPPLYDWILYALQSVLGPGNAGFAILNYGALYACVMIFYQVARRVVGDPRLQAAAAYSMSLLWDIGHESHRILTHSNLMIVAIAASVLLLVIMRERRSTGLYVVLGLVMALGMLSKFGYAAFAGTALIAALFVPSFRAVVTDRRILISLVAAALPLAVFYAATLMVDQSIAGETGRALSVRMSSGFGERIVALLRALFGYIIPLAPVALAVFFIRPVRSTVAATPAQDDYRRFALIQLGLGVAVAVFWVMVLGSTQVRPRYFHALLLIFPVTLFAVLQIYAWTERQLRIFLGITLFIALGIMAEQAIARLVPAEALCGTCRQSVPFNGLGRAVAARFGESPTVVAIDPYRAGQMRVGLPEARFVTLEPVPYRPPARPAQKCLAVWQSDTPADERAALLKAAGAVAGTAETVSVTWFQPFLPGRRTSEWSLLPLPTDSPLCR